MDIDSEKFNIHDIRIKGDRPQILTSISSNRDYLRLHWVDYLNYQLSIRMVTINDNLVTLKSLVDEEFPEAEEQKIWRK